MDYELEEVSQYTLGFNEGFEEGFRAGLEAAKQAIIAVEENENKNNS
jgi:flagellar biosynthesis/type III secretory pathway protein FliH